jgi:hypothetical protein
LAAPILLCRAGNRSWTLNVAFPPNVVVSCSCCCCSATLAETAKSQSRRRIRVQRSAASHRQLACEHATKIVPVTGDHALLIITDSTSPPNVCQKLRCMMACATDDPTSCRLNNMPLHCTATGFDPLFEF